jgi:hypothetical protein
MDNHYHLVLENCSGRLSDFFRHLNGQYGMYFRKMTSEKGYVFQNRFKSTIIQDDLYLKRSLGYLLLNPIRAGIVQFFDHYLWSSGRYYFSEQKSDIVDVEFVNELFGSKSQLLDFLSTMGGGDLSILETRFGEILGDTGYIEEALERFNRRKNWYGDGMKRIDERFFSPLEKVLMEYEKKIGIKLEEINLNTLEGKRMRGELLTWLKDEGGLRYPEISKLPLFWGYRLTSMAKLYRDTKLRLKQNFPIK